MGTTITCSGCGQQYKVAPTLYGKQVKCTQCGATLKIPLEEPNTVAPAADELVPFDLSSGDPLSNALGDAFANSSPNPFALDPMAGGVNDPFNEALAQAAGAAQPQGQTRKSSTREAEAASNLRLIWMCSIIAGSAMFLLLLVIAVNSYSRAQAARQAAKLAAPPASPAKSTATTPTSAATTSSIPEVPAALPEVPPTGSAEASGLTIPQFPELGTPQLLPPTGVATYAIDLTNVAGNNAALPGMAMQMRVYLPPGEHPAKSLACVLVAPAGTNLLRGMELDPPDQSLEQLPYVAAGMAVVHYTLDGAIPESTPADENSQAQALVVAYPKFRDAQGGILNGRHALEFVLAKLPQVDPEKIYCAGHSSAGTVSLLLAAHEPRIKACLAYAPATDLEHGDVSEIMSNPAVANAFPGIAEFLKLTSPNTHAASFRCPLFLFHARDDSNTPFAKSVAFAQLLEQSGNKPTFAEVPTGDHFDSMIQQGIPQGIAWLKALPSAPPAAPTSTPPSGEANNPPPENSSK